MRITLSHRDNNRHIPQSRFSDCLQEICRTKMKHKHKSSVLLTVAWDEDLYLQLKFTLLRRNVNSIDSSLDPVSSACVVTVVCDDLSVNTLKNGSV